MRFRRTIEPLPCSPWPDASQLQLLQTLFGPDECAAEEYARWIAAVDLSAGLDSGSERLLPMLEFRLRQLGITDGHTPRLRAFARQAWTENSWLFARTGDLLGRIADAGIGAMLLKGAPLALVYYPGHACRPMSDIDLLVRSPDSVRAMEIIAAAGWSRAIAKKPWMERMNTHATGFVDGRHQIDLHWRPLYEIRTKSASRWFWRDALPMKLGDATTLRPRGTALLLNVIIHGVRDNPASPIRWLADAMMILRSERDEIDWDDISAFAICERIGWRLGLGLDYLRTHFAAPIPTEVTSRLFAARQSIFERADNITLLSSSYPKMSGLFWLFSRASRKSLRTLALLDHWK